MSNIVKIAKSQVGKKGKKFNLWYGNPISWNWCGAFVTWCFYKAGRSEDFCPKSKNPSYVPNIHEWAKKNKRIIKNKKSAKPGDVVIFDWGSDGTRDHVGIVSNNAGSVLITIEGNTGSDDATRSIVAKKERYFSDVLCVIRPYNKEAKEKAPKKPSTPKKKTTKKKAVSYKKKFKVIPREGMNVRKRPSTKAGIVTAIPCGETFTASKKEGNWVYANKFNGWICVKKGKEMYLEEV